LVLLVPTSPATAQPASTKPSKDLTAEQDAAARKALVAEAKRLFKEGNVHYEAKRYQRALALFRQSRQKVNSLSATKNAAMCLEALGRHDEAHEMYLQLLSAHGDRLRAAEKTALRARLERLESKLATLQVVANVAGQLIIDGRRRGKLPMSSVLLLPGEHRVSVLEEGYETYHSTLVVKAGATATIRAELVALRAAGKLRVEAPAGAQTFVDGARVSDGGQWQGVLSTGPHRYQVRKGDEGTAPKLVTIVGGQIAVVTPMLKPLGPQVHLSVEPATAELVLGDVLLGPGHWRGRLPVGSWSVAAREQGYFSAERTIEVSRTSASDLRLRLQVDNDHPRWGVTGGFWIEAFGGFGIAPSLGSSLESSCSGNFTCTANPAALGVLVGGRAGYELPNRLSIELTGGYLYLLESIERERRDQVVVKGDSYSRRHELVDELRLSGPVMAGGVSYRFPIAPIVDLRAGLAAGVQLTSSRDLVSGTATLLATTTTPSSTTNVVAAGSGVAVGEPNFVILPRLQLSLRLVGSFGLSIEFAAAVLARGGPDPVVKDVSVSHAGCAPSSVTIGCSSAVSLYSDDAPHQAYGPLVVLLPGLSAGYMF